MRLIAATTADISQADVTVHTTFLGGGFGRRAEVDLVRQAVTCALAMPDRPVQVLWSREEDMRNTTSTARWRWRAGAPSSMSPGCGQACERRQAAGRPVAGGPGSPSACWGCRSRAQPEGNAVENPAYGFPFYRLEAIVPEGPVPVGFWRSVGHSHTAFFDESFIDETGAGLEEGSIRVQARVAGGQAAARARCWRRRRKEAGWGSPLPAGSGRGIALRASFGSIVAQVAEVSVADGKTLKVKRVTCAIDCGPVVNPAIVRMQMESGIVYGLSAALYGEITLANGAVEQANFTDYQVVQLADAPVDVRAHRRQRRLGDRRRRRARHAADRARRGQRGVCRHRPAPAQPAAQARLTSKFPRVSRCVGNG